MSDGLSKAKRYLTQDVQAWPALVGVALVICWMIAVAGGRPRLGWSILLVGLVALVVGGRLLPPKTVRLEEAAELPYDRERVWNLIVPAENAPRVDARIRSGYRVPGTPEGLGERQAFEALDGTTTVVEVVELAPGRRAVVRVVSPLDVPMSITHEIGEVLGRPGCVYRQSAVVDLPRGRRLRPGFEKQWRATTRASFERISAELSGSSWPPPAV